MQLWIFAALLILQCWAPLVSLQSTDTDKLTSVGTVDISGSSVRVFELGGAKIQVAEPKISFGKACDIPKYNTLYDRFELTLSLQISFPDLSSSTASSKKVGQVSLTGLKVTGDMVQAFRDTGMPVLARLKGPGEAQLIFLCDSLVRCQKLTNYTLQNPEEVRLAIEFVPSGMVEGKSVSFGAIRSSNSPSFDCWVVFQRRVDGSLSFAQNWDAYVSGFGTPDSNYWMGLDKIHTMTVTSKDSSTPAATRCRLRLEAEDFKGKSYWGEYALFEVLGADQNYRLRIGQEVAGSQFENIAYQNEMQFSTIDRDNDKYSASCSTTYGGRGGWWFNECKSISFNGAYGNDTVTKDENFASAYMASENYHVTMKRTLMKFRCQ